MIAARIAPTCFRDILPRTYSRERFSLLGFALANSSFSRNFERRHAGPFLALAMPPSITTPPPT